MRRGELVAQAHVDGQLLADLEVVLQIAEVHALLVIHNHRVVQRVTVAKAEHEVRQIVEVVRRRDANGNREAAAISILPVFRIEVVDGGIEALVFESGL